MNCYKALSNGGKRSCKYYKVCENTENCMRCISYRKETKEREKRKAVQNETN